MEIRQTRAFLKHLIEIISAFEKGKIGFISLRENIDTTSPRGKLIFHIFGALAELEREIIMERTNSGLLATGSRGKKVEDLEFIKQVSSS